MDFFYILGLVGMYFAGNYTGRKSKEEEYAFLEQQKVIKELKQTVDQYKLSEKKNEVV